MARSMTSSCLFALLSLLAFVSSVTAAPVIESISPNRIREGQSPVVTITGLGFGADATAIKVWYQSATDINTKPEFSSVSILQFDRVITAVFPSSSITLNSRIYVQITINGETSAANTNQVGATNEIVGIEATTAACSYSSCSECTQDLTCGWCAATSTCAVASVNSQTQRSEGPLIGTCGTGGRFLNAWYYSTCPAISCSVYSTCQECQEDKYQLSGQFVKTNGCGWCSSTSRCLDNNPTDPAQQANPQPNTDPAVIPGSSCPIRRTCDVENPTLDCMPCDRTTSSGCRISSNGLDSYWPYIYDWVSSNTLAEGAQCAANAIVPIITQVLPSTGIPLTRTQITLYGNNFASAGAVQGAITVTYGTTNGQLQNRPCSDVVWNTNLGYITCFVGTDIQATWATWFTVTLTNVNRVSSQMGTYTPAVQVCNPTINNLVTVVGGNSYYQAGTVNQQIQVSGSCFSAGVTTLRYTCQNPGAAGQPTYTAQCTNVQVQNANTLTCTVSNTDAFTTIQWCQGLQWTVTVTESQALTSPAWTQFYITQWLLVNEGVCSCTGVTGQTSGTTQRVYGCYNSYSTGLSSQLSATFCQWIAQPVQVPCTCTLEPITDYYWMFAGWSSACTPTTPCIPFGSSQPAPIPAQWACVRSTYNPGTAITARRFFFEGATSVCEQRMSTLGLGSLPAICVENNAADTLNGNNWMTCPVSQSATGSFPSSASSAFGLTIYQACPAVEICNQLVQYAWLRTGWDSCPSCLSGGQSFYNRQSNYVCASASYVSGQDPSTYIYSIVSGITGFDACTVATSGGSVSLPILCGLSQGVTGTPTTNCDGPVGMPTQASSAAALVSITWPCTGLTSCGQTVYAYVRLGWNGCPACYNQGENPNSIYRYGSYMCAAATVTTGQDPATYQWTSTFNSVECDTYALTAPAVGNTPAGNIRIICVNTISSQFFGVNEVTCQEQGDFGNLAYTPSYNALLSGTGYRWQCTGVAQCARATYAWVRYGWESCPQCYEAGQSASSYYRRGFYTCATAQVSDGQSASTYLWSATDSFWCDQASLTEPESTTLPFIHPANTLPIICVNQATQAGQWFTGASRVDCIDGDFGIPDYAGTAVQLAQTSTIIWTCSGLQQCATRTYVWMWSGFGQCNAHNCSTTLGSQQASFQCAYIESVSTTPVAGDQYTTFSTDGLFSTPCSNSFTPLSVFCSSETLNTLAACNSSYALPTTAIVADLISYRHSCVDNRPCPTYYTAFTGWTNCTGTCDNGMRQATWQCVATYNTDADRSVFTVVDLVNCNSGVSRPVICMDRNTRKQTECIAADTTSIVGWVSSAAFIPSLAARTCVLDIKCDVPVFIYLGDAACAGTCGIGRRNTFWSCGLTNPATPTKAWVLSNPRDARCDGQPNPFEFTRVVCIADPAASPATAASMEIVPCDQPMDASFSFTALTRQPSIDWLSTAVQYQCTLPQCVQPVFLIPPTPICPSYCGSWTLPRPVKCAWIDPTVEGFAPVVYQDNSFTACLNAPTTTTGANYATKNICVDDNGAPVACTGTGADGQPKYDTTWSRTNPPATQRVCPKIPCVAYAWVVGPWSACDCINNTPVQFATRQVTCASFDPTVPGEPFYTLADNVQCLGAPLESQTVTIGTTPTQQYGLSLTCVDAGQNYVACDNLNYGVTLQFGIMPQTQKQCTPNRCCGARWTEFAWGACVPSGQMCQGIRQRAVQCLYPPALGLSGIPDPSCCTGVANTTETCAIECRIVGDPEFTGFMGQKYEVHGVPNAVFNIITSPFLQYNALFVYIGQKSGNACNITRTHPWTHAGTYLGTLGFKTGDDRIEIVSGTCVDGIQSVKVNGAELSVGDFARFDEIDGNAQNITFVDEYTVQLNFAEVTLTLTNSDSFFNQDVRMTSYGAKLLNTHGLLGQTWSKRTFVTHGIRRVYEGTSADYMVQDEDIFGDDFIFNRFNKA